MLVTLGALSFAASAATINVNSNATLSSALSSVNPGDTIVLANGSYAGFTVSRSGTASAPIVIEAANQGSATISSGIVNLNGVSYVILQGLSVTTSGGSLAVDSTTRNVGVALVNASNCEVTRCTFRLNSPSGDTFWVMLGGHSDSNRIDYNEFGPQNVTTKQNYIAPMGSVTIAGVTPPSDRTSWADGNGPVNPNMARNTRIDHNYLHDKPATSNGGEAIALGAIGVTGDYQNVNGIVEYNLFVNCDADPEIITVKSSSNTVRFNTIRTCAGMLSLRSGNSSAVYGNIMLQGGKAGSGGIKIYEKDHPVFDNYIDHADQYPILIGAGDAYSSSSFSHAQVFNAMVVHNTIVNLSNRPVIMGHGSTLAPTDVVFANNIIQGTAAQLYDERVKPAGSSVYASNIVWSSGTGVPSSGFQIVNPQLTTVNGLQKLSSSSPAINAANPSYFSFVTDDMDGQPRDARPDIGADEFSSAPITRIPLTTADVGPLANQTPAASAPAFSPAGGTFASAQNVTITSATSGASIRYTLDGSTPSENAGTLYSGSPVAIGSTATLEAIAYKTGFTDSVVTSATYTITMPQAAAPTFSPAAGTYNNDQTVTISSATSGASIRYTLDGSTPSETVGTLYSGSPVAIGSTATLRAIAFESGFSDSTVSIAPYTLAVAPVTFSPAAGTYASAQNVTLSTVTSGATIRYTTDGSTPSETAGTLYSDIPVVIGSTATLKAIAYKSGYSDSPVTNVNYTITLPQVAAPSFSPAGGTYTSAQTVSISSTTGGVSFRYTTDGSTPSETVGTLYSGAVTIGATTTLRVIGFENGFSDSTVVSATYTFGPPPTLNFEAESLSPVGTGATVSISNDANASGGVVEFLNSTAAGQIMTFTTPSIVAGTYQVQLRYKTNTTRGEHTVKIDGTQIGGTINQYSTTVGYTTVTLGNVTFGSASTHTIALTVTGKVSASTQFYITADKFTFVGQ